MCGTLQVRNAINLQPTEGNTHSDPYAVLVVEGQKKKTKTVKNTLHPHWNEEWTINVTRTGTLEVRVLDRDRFGQDQVCGQVSCKLDGQRIGWCHY